MSQDRSGAIDVGADSGDGTDDIDLTSLKEAFELPDSLPPIRLPSIAELAAQARQAPLAGQLAALAAWVGAGGRRIDEAGDLSPADAAAAAAAIGAGADDFAYLWEYAIAADWLSDDDADEDRVLPGEAAEAWTDDTDEDVCFAWFGTLGAVLNETLEVAGALGAARADAPAAGEDDDYDEEDDQDDEDDEDDGDEPDDDGGGEPALDFLGLPLALAILLFTSRAEGVPRAELAEVFWADAAVDMTAAQAAVAREEWLAAYGDPVRAAARQAGRAGRDHGSRRHRPADPAGPGRPARPARRGGRRHPAAAADRGRAHRRGTARDGRGRERGGVLRGVRRVGRRPRGRSRPRGNCSTWGRTATRATGCSRWPRSPASARPPRRPGGTA